jgi:hypothetical protein
MSALDWYQCQKSANGGNSFVQTHHIYRRFNYNTNQNGLAHIGQDHYKTTGSFSQIKW